MNGRTDSVAYVIVVIIFAYVLLSALAGVDPQEALGIDDYNWHCTNICR